MRTCTFFGEPDATNDIRYDLKQTLIDLIENKGVVFFLVGNEGNFDKMVRTELKLFSTVYGHIMYNVLVCDTPDTKFAPEDIEDLNFCPLYGMTREKIITPDKRNKWMINKSQCVVTYVTKPKGYAHKYKSVAEKKKKKIIELHNEE